MSWFSAAFTRAKSVITAGVSLVPFVGGAAASVIGGIHTGDEHQDASGQWVSNSTGAPTITPPNAQLQSEIDRIRQVEQNMINQARQELADTTARIGAAATLKAAAAIGPEGNFYQRALNNPLALGAGLLVAGGLLFLVLRKK